MLYRKEKIDQIHDYIEKNDWPLNPRKSWILIKRQSFYKHGHSNGEEINNN